MQFYKYNVNTLAGYDVHVSSRADLVRKTYAENQTSRFNSLTSLINTHEYMILTEIH